MKIGYNYGMISGPKRTFYLNEDLDAIEEVVEYLYSKLGDWKSSTAYQLHIGYGDDLPNTIHIHENFLEEELLELLECIEVE